MSPYIAWPDIASFHYANSVVNFPKSKNLKFVLKNLNPASLPKARPIEDFWGNLKRIVYAGGWTAKTVTQLKNRIVASLKKIDLNFIQAHMKSVRSRLDKVARYGINSI